MNKSLFFATALFLSVTGSAHAQTADDLNEGSQLSQDSQANFSYFKWWGKMGRTYFVQESGDLEQWNYTDIIESGFDRVLEYGWQSNFDKLFLRLQFTDQSTTDPELDDFDGDGISNIGEITMQPAQGNPFDASSNDGDAMADDWEMFHELSTQPGVDESQLDPDGDTLANLFEYSHRTDPNEPDTDGDGLLDGNDISGGQDPLFADHPAVEFTIFSSLND